ncbi:MAG TPA: SRPBCC family protein [Gemmatimonadaceae bacterium]|jgi:ribosome-associated toxin RatA of RatAB toxin-antitoxin module|nr:SRPBCC family protein [Gemmatimonadaceae bacterium]
MSRELAGPFELGPMPIGCAMEEVDSQYVHAPIPKMFGLAARVEKWPTYLPHYRYVKFRERRSDGGGVVEMSAYRPFSMPKRLRLPLRFNWPTWWLSEMSVDETKASIRFRHIGGITKGMEVEWTFMPAPNGTHVRIVHVWDGPGLEIGEFAATWVIGPIFIHGIASRTLAGLAAVAEKTSRITQ